MRTLERYFRITGEVGDKSRWSGFSFVVVNSCNSLCVVDGLEAYFLLLCSLSSFYSHMFMRFQDMVRRGEIIDNDTEDEFYLRRLDAGLFVLQHICYIMAEICNASVPQVGGPSPVGLAIPASFLAICWGRDSQRKKWIQILLEFLPWIWALLSRDGSEMNSFNMMYSGVHQDKWCFFSLSPLFPFLVRFAREFTRSWTCEEAPSKLSGTSSRVSWMLVMSGASGD